MMYRHSDIMSLLFVISLMKKERLKQSLTLSEVSKRSGISKSRLSNLESGRTLNPILNTLWRYADAIGIDLVLGILER